MFQLPREGCRVGSVWSASPCFACWSLWLAGPGPLWRPVAPGCFPGRPGFFVSVSPLRLKRTRAPTPSVRHAQEIITVLVVEQQVRVLDPVGLRWLTGLGARVFIVECDTVVPCRRP